MGNFPLVSFQLKNDTLKDVQCEQCPRPAKESETPPPRTHGSGGHSSVIGIPTPNLPLPLCVRPKICHRCEIGRE